MKLIIVDDEPPARERLRRLLAEIEDCEVVAEAGNGEEALSRCGELRPDVVLLDVRMPGLSGIQIARHIDTLEDPPAVIFTTAYDQYAVEAFETEAVGYLLKPVRKEKLAHALRHAARISPSRLVKVDESLKTLAEEFAPDFVRIHRNALIAEKQISAVERTDSGQYVVRVRECGDVLEVSRRHASELLRRIR